MTHDDQEHPQPSRHDGEHDEPLGPATPDHARPLGDTPEAHDEISPHDLPLDSPGRKAAEHRAAETGRDTVTGRD